ncbi:MAG: hypothetical protein IPG50_15590 [Myxococcales bacterium]|nr:hypothetical protein [Myxococcales bacterium]
MSSMTFSCRSAAFLAFTLASGCGADDTEAAGTARNELRETTPRSTATAAGALSETSLESLVLGVERDRFRRLTGCISALGDAVHSDAKGLPFARFIGAAGQLEPIHSNGGFLPTQTCLSLGGIADGQPVVVDIVRRDWSVLRLTFAAEFPYPPPFSKALSLYTIDHQLLPKGASFAGKAHLAELCAQDPNSCE